MAQKYSSKFPLDIKVASVRSTQVLTITETTYLYIYLLLREIEIMILNTENLDISNKGIESTQV